MWRPRSISLRTRIRIAIIALVTVLVAIQSLASLRLTAQGSFQDALERSQSVATQVRTLLVDRLNLEAVRASPPPSTLEESKQIWTVFLENDPSIPGLLEKLLATPNVAVEIQVYDEVGRILVSSIATQARLTYRSLPDFGEWQIRPLWGRLFEVVTEDEQYATTVPLGVEQQDRPLFTIRVITSSVLMRNTLRPQINSLATISLLSLVAAILLAVLVSNAVLRALDRLGRQIDMITSGEASPGETTPRESREVAAVSSKLHLLGEQYRDAKAAAVELRGNIDQLLQNLEAAVMMFDPDGRLVLAGRQAERILGRVRGTLIGTAMEDLFPDSGSLGAAIQSALRQKRPFRERPLLLERNGLPPRRVLASVDLLENYPGLHRLGTLVTLRDIESRHQLQSQLDVSTRLTAINRLTGGVAHEIKNPLNAIALHLEVMKAKLVEPNTVSTELEVIEREIARLDRVVKTFLDFTRPVELDRQTVDLAALLDEVAALVSPQATGAGVRIQVETGARPALIRADRDLLKHAILNVVVNGIESMSGGGDLRIGLATAGDEYSVTIQDQGSGIPAEVRDRVFDLYFTTKVGGSGIGLAMAFRVVHLHGATIDFTSTPGRGTTFELRIAAVEASRAGADHDTLSPAYHRQ